MKKILVVCLVLGLPLFLLTACADGGDSGDGDNGGGDSITLYSPETPDLTKQLAQKYEEVHGDKVNVHYAGTNVLVNQMMAEKGVLLILIVLRMYPSPFQNPSRHCCLGSILRIELSKV